MEELQFVLMFCDRGIHRDPRVALVDEPVWRCSRPWTPAALGCALDPR
jgi:hypothetical protein